MGEAHVLYRKYRSGSFAEVIGQDHIVRTLSSAIAANRIAHAYLFTGPRGTGKTSVARLLARAANCTGKPKPCGTCPCCQAAVNSNLDIIEIDAASNRSIDSIRDLRDKVAQAPNLGSHKVYIIDEVHMLTTEAFNALLKTLEEPPAHVIFILATTEAHKVPDTIISRTQRLNFRPIRLSDLTNHLMTIAQKEGLTLEPEAVSTIARASRGGFRDALSMLDQVATTAAGGRITSEVVQDVLGYSDHQEIQMLAEAIASRDSAAAVQIASSLFDRGAAPAQTILGLINLWQDLMRATAIGEALDEDATKLATATGLHRMAIILETLLGISRSAWPEVALEAVLVKLTTDPLPATTPAGPSLAVPPNAAPSPAAAAQASSTSAPQATPDATTASTPPATRDSIDDASVNEAPLAAELWPKVLVVVKSKNNSLGALLQMYQTEFAGDQVTIKPRFNFHRDLFLKPINRTLIETAASKVYGRPVKIHARTEDDGKGSGVAKRKPKPDPNAELVSSALEILGGEVID